MIPLPPPTGRRDTLKIEELRHRCPDCNAYVDRAARAGLTNSRGQHRGGSPINDDNNDDGGGNNDGGGTPEMPDGVGDKFEAPLEKDKAKFGS